MSVKILNVKQFIELRRYYTSSLIAIGINEIDNLSYTQKLQMLDLNTQVAIYSYALTEAMTFDEASELLGSLTVDEFSKTVGKFNQVISSFTSL